MQHDVIVPVAEIEQLRADVRFAAHIAAKARVSTRMFRNFLPVVFLLGLSAGVMFERWAHACSPVWSISGWLGTVIDARCPRESK